MSQVVVVRHGQTDWNLHGRLQGATDIPLNDHGRAQARHAAAYLADHLDGSTHVVSSHLSRARETAEIIAAALGTDVTTDARLAERSFGIWEGTTLADRIRDTPEAVERWDAHSDPGVEGSESAAATGERFAAALADHASAHGAVLAVGHGAAARLGIQSLLGMGAGRGFEGLGNTQAAVLRRRPDGWRLLRYGIGPSTVPGPL